MCVCVCVCVCVCMYVCVCLRVRVRDPLLLLPPKSLLSARADATRYLQPGLDALRPLLQLVDALSGVGALWLLAPLLARES